MQKVYWILGLLSLPLVTLLAKITPASQITEPPTSSQPDQVMNLTSKSNRQELAAYQAYQDAIAQTVGMVRDSASQRLAIQMGLNILDITWEDTGRYKGSAVGPNISDMTIQVQQFNPKTGKYELSLMPVIRHPNFSDESADIPLERFFLLVGNEKDKNLERVSLKDFLGDLRNYLSNPSSWKGNRTSLLAERDTHALISAQACFLPIPQKGKAEFNPVLFNYQSYAGDPAVLTILATREGTSVTIIDNKRDGFEAGRTWGQRLFFNKNGERASLIGQRLSDFQLEQTLQPTSPSTEAAEEEGLNMVLLIQVPLKQKQPMRPSAEVYMDAAPTMTAAPVMKRSNVEAAVIGHGRVEGPFTEIDNLEIERDPRFPVRVTVQFYKATSNGVVSKQDLQEIQQQIARVYKDADYVGSLVLSGDTRRPTEYDGSKQEPPGWWNSFWQRYFENTGQSREEAMEMLRRLRGDNWMPRTPEELRQELEQLQS